MHAVVEATKQAFLEIRDKHVTDPAWMKLEPQSLLTLTRGLATLAANIDMRKAHRGAASPSPAARSGWA